MTEHKIEGPRVRCFADPAWSDIALYIAWRKPGGIGRLEPVNSPLLDGERPDMEWVDEAGQSGPPTLRLSGEAAQELMNSLWECGIRPVQGKGSAGQLDATLRHLEDMRQIAFGKLEIGKP